VTAFLIPLYLLMIVSLPALVAIAPILLSSSVLEKLLWSAVCPVIYGGAYVLVAGVLSLRHQHAVKPGRFPRRLSDPTYGHRRLYGLCWTAVYYFKPIYFVFLSVPLLKKGLFRLFGYRGSTDFTIYPDTWIRDLPVLTFGKGAYLSNKATIGTNIAFRNGTLLVDRVSVGEGSLVGHLALLAPGVMIGNQSEVGVATAVGLKVNLGNHVKVGVASVIDHGVVLEDNVTVGTWVHIGVGTKIKSGARVASGTTIAARVVVESESAQAAGDGS
jgi:acetyltransferase-like isoleucine patch superfamily enzyme